MILVVNVSISDKTLVGSLPGDFTRPATRWGLWRIANILMALAALIFLAPLLMVIIVAVFIQDAGPVFFAHRRIGQGGREFRCLKFRSMCIDAEARLEALLAEDPVAREEWERGYKLRFDPRVTRVGDFLRRSSLDELPQLFNVLRGEMNMVGPRPIVQAEVARYGRRFSSYASVKPGITGLWQVSGRSDLSYRTRVAMDCLYAHRHGPLMDLRIILGTIPAVLSRRGSY